MAKETIHLLNEIVSKFVVEVFSRNHRIKLLGNAKSVTLAGTMLILGSGLMADSFVCVEHPYHCSAVTKQELLELLQKVSKKCT
jgi:hypothetical protein